MRFPREEKAPIQREVSANSLDKAMRLFCNFPIGLLELCDLAGADVVLHGLETMYAEFGERLARLLHQVGECRQRYELAGGEVVSKRSKPVTASLGITRPGSPARRIWLPRRLRLARDSLHLARG